MAWTRRTSLAHRWPRGRALLGLLLIASMGCASVAEIRIENVSDLDFAEVSIAGEPFGDVAVGETTEYRPVPLRLSYALVRLTACGYRVNAQTLNLGARRFTHRIDILDLEAGRLGVEIVREGGG